MHPARLRLLAQQLKQQLRKKTWSAYHVPDCHIKGLLVYTLVVVFPHACLGILLYNYTRFNVSKTATNPRVKISKAYYESLCLWHRQSVSSEKQMLERHKKKNRAGNVWANRGGIYTRFPWWKCILLCASFCRARQNVLAQMLNP